LELPQDAPAEWNNIFTGETVRDFDLAGVLRRFPVALLTSGN
jgi:hypothetical protein